MVIQINAYNMSNSWAFEEVSIKNPVILTFSLSSVFCEFNMGELIGS